jgi:hypothetical protein
MRFDGSGKVCASTVSSVTCVCQRRDEAELAADLIKYIFERYDPHKERLRNKVAILTPYRYAACCMLHSNTLKWYLHGHECSVSCV